MNKPTIDQQILWISQLNAENPDTLERKKGDYYIGAVKENLLSIKRWNQNPLWSDLDIEKVLLDLLMELREALRVADDIQSTPAIQNAEAALGLLKAFKTKRDTTHQWLPPKNSAHSFTEGSDFNDLNQLADGQREI